VRSSSSLSCLPSLLLALRSPCSTPLHSDPRLQLLRPKEEADAQTIGLELLQLGDSTFYLQLHTKLSGSELLSREQEGQGEEEGVRRGNCGEVETKGELLSSTNR